MKKDEPPSFLQGRYPLLIGLVLLCFWTSPIVSVLDCFLTPSESDFFTFPNVCCNSQNFSGSFTIPPTACSSQQFTVCEAEFIYDSGPGFNCDTTMTSTYSKWSCASQSDSLLVNIFQSGSLCLPIIVNGQPISITIPTCGSPFPQGLSNLDSNPTVNMTYNVGNINVSPGETLTLAYWEQFYGCQTSDNAGYECITVVLRPCSTIYLSGSPSTTPSTSAKIPSSSSSPSRSLETSPSSLLTTSISTTTSQFNKPTTKTTKTTTTPSAPSYGSNLRKVLEQNPIKVETKSDVTASNYQLTDSTSQHDVSVFIKSGDLITGSISIPANTFPPGCVIQIRSSSKQVSTPSLSDGSECSGSQDSGTKLLSSQFSLTLSGTCKNQTKFDHFLDIQLVVDRQEAKQGCVAYSPRGSSDWSCLETLIDNVNGSGYSVVSGNVNHFTSFAVLLLPECPTEDWIWIASIVLVGGSLLTVLLIASAFLLNARFRGFVGGYRASRLSFVMNKLEKANTSSRSIHQQ